MASENVRSADDQQVRKKILDEYFAGFVDGEGCFYIGFSKRKDLPLNWQIITEFRLSQNPGGKNILELFQSRIKCGIIKRNHPKNDNDKTWVMVVRDREDLNNKIIPFFKKHPLRTIKQQDFQIFRKVLEIIKRGKHLKRNGFEKIVNLVFSNQKVTKKKYLKSDLL